MKTQDELKMNSTYWTEVCSMHSTVDTLTPRLIYLGSNGHQRWLGPALCAPQSVPAAHWRGGGTERWGGCSGLRQRRSAASCPLGPGWGSDEDSVWIPDPPYCPLSNAHVDPEAVTHRQEMWSPSWEEKRQFISWICQVSRRQLYCPQVAAITSCCRFKRKNKLQGWKTFSGGNFLNACEIVKHRQHWNWRSKQRCVKLKCCD